MKTFQSCCFCPLLTIACFLTRVYTHTEKLFLAVTVHCSAAHYFQYTHLLLPSPYVPFEFPCFMVILQGCSHTQSLAVTVHCSATHYFQYVYVHSVPPSLCSFWIPMFHGYFTRLFTHTKSSSYCSLFSHPLLSVCIRAFCSSLPVFLLNSHVSWLFYKVVHTHNP
jgi:hypothetical protein